ncbi:MAG: RsiV family protein [Bacteroidales bacterium]|nr:RsiV family protein [Bacteroidales bacterium]
MKNSFLLGMAAVLVLMASCDSSKAPLKLDVRDYADSSSYARIRMEIALPVAKGEAASAIRSALVDVMDEALAHVSGGSERAFDRFEGNPDDAESLFSYYEKQALHSLAEASDQDCGDRLLGIYESTTLSDSEKKFYADNIAGWVYEYSLRKVEETQKYVVFDSRSYVNYGGTHGGIVGDGPLVFSKKDGHLVRSIFEPDSAKDLQKLLRGGLQEYFQPRADGTGLELDAFLSLPEDGQVPLPAWAPYPVADSLHFVYQQYEIAPYASGMPEFSLPYDKVRKYLTDDARKTIGR